MTMTNTKANLEGSLKKLIEFFKGHYGRGWSTRVAEDLKEIKVSRQSIHYLSQGSHFPRWDTYTALQDLATKLGYKD